MKRLAIAMMLGIAAMSASAQVNYKMQVACNPQDVKTYDTNRLRQPVSAVAAAYGVGTAAREAQIPQAIGPDVRGEAFL